MSANLPQPLSQERAAALHQHIAVASERWVDTLVSEGADRDIAKREVAFALAHAAARFGLDPTGTR